MGDRVLICTQCHRVITDKYYYLVSDKCLHVSCLKCTECKRTLQTESTCFCRDGRLFCKTDFIRLLNKIIASYYCSACYLQIIPTDMVIRVDEDIYHSNCFACRSCGLLLHSRDPFYVQRGFIFCNIHAADGAQLILNTSLNRPTTNFDTTSLPPDCGLFPFERGSSQPHPCLSRDLLTAPSSEILKVLPGKILQEENKEGGERLNIAETAKIKRRGRPRKRVDSERVEKIFSSDQESSECRDTNCCEVTEVDSSPSSRARRKRMRSSFKQHQLKVMKAYFGLNQNPDSKELKDISNRTGLLTRVIQVWFQNTRAKYRRTVAYPKGSVVVRRYQKYKDVLTMYSGDVTRSCAFDTGVTTHTAPPPQFTPSPTASDTASVASVLYDSSFNCLPSCSTIML